MAEELAATAVEASTEPLPSAVEPSINEAAPESKLPDSDIPVVADLPVDAASPPAEDSSVSRDQSGFPSALRSKDGFLVIRTEGDKDYEMSLKDLGQGRAEDR